MAQTEVHTPELDAAGELARPQLSIVVTLLNEGATVDELYRRTVETVATMGVPYELIFVDDGSTDDTFARVERLHDADPHVRAVKLKRNFGQHPAMHAGLVRARGDYVVTMDGDLQNEPEDIPKLLAALDRAEVASGRRVARTDSAGRTVPSRVINGLLRRFTGAQSFAILPLGVGNLQASGVAQDQAGHVQRRWCSVNGAGVAHFHEQRQSTGMIQMSVGENDRIEFAIRRRWRAI